MRNSYGNYQPLFTPKLLACPICGVMPDVLDWDFKDCWKVYQNCQHSIRKSSETIHRNRAIHRWNNAVIKFKNHI